MSPSEPTDTVFLGVDPERFPGTCIAIRPRDGAFAIGRSGVARGPEREGLCLYSAVASGLALNPAAQSWAGVGRVVRARGTWTEAQRISHARRCGLSSFVEAQAFVETAETSTSSDPLAAMAAAAAVRVPNAELCVLVVDAGIGIYRFTGNRIEAVLRLGAGLPSLVGGNPLPGAAKPNSGPATLLELLAELYETDLSELEAPASASAVPFAGHDSQESFADGYYHWRVALCSQSPDGAQRAGLTRAALDVAARDIERLAATARQVVPDTPLLIVGSGCRPRRLREFMEQHLRAAVTVPDDTTAALGAAVLCAWANRPEGLLRLSGEPIRAEPNMDPESLARFIDDDRRDEVSKRIAASVSVPTMTAPLRPAGTGLDELVAPLELSDFLEDYADRQALVLRGDSGRFSEILDGDTLLRLVREVHERHPYAHEAGTSHIEMFEQGNYLPPAPPTRPYPPRWDEAESWDQAHRHGTSNGWTTTLRLSAAHHCHPTLAPLLWQLHEVFGTRCHINAYYSPGASGPGLDYHFDDTHVLVLQLEGSKYWELAPGPIRSPLERQRRLAQLNAGNTGTSSRHVWLSKGDALYVPAQTWHRPVALEGPSLHLTLAAGCQTGGDFLAWLGEQLAADEAFVGSVSQPSRDGAGSLALDRERLERVISGIRAHLEDRSVLDRFIADAERSARDKTALGSFR
ncbi:MAG: cupin domain-containing protein [Myxococcota bacterium]